MKFVALGRTHWLRDAVLMCVDRGHEVAAVASAPGAAEYRVDEAGFAELARDLGCPYFAEPDLRGARMVGPLTELGAEVAVSVNWPTLIGPEIRAVFSHGIVNAHCGALPRYRGNACPNWAILRGEESVGLTVHEMTDELDAGPVYAQRIFPVTESTYIADVYRFMDEAVPAMFADVLDSMDRGDARARPQDRDLALRTLPRVPADSAIGWSAPATAIARLVRASAEPFAGATALLDGEELVIWRAHAIHPEMALVGVPGQVTAIDRERGSVEVLTGRGLLVVEEVSGPDGARCAAADVIRSTRQRLGSTPAAEIAALRDLITENGTA